MMTDLGRELRRLREGVARSIRWVERRSKQAYPAERGRQISHTYLRQIEEGIQCRPSPGKLRTLAEIYGVEYQHLLTLAGILDSLPADADGTGDPDMAERPVRELCRRLQSQGIRPEYFMKAVTDLPDESLSIVHRLITTLSVQSKAKPRRRQAEMTEGGGEGAS